MNVGNEWLTNRGEAMADSNDFLAISVVIVDGRLLLREALAKLLDRNEQVDLVATVGDAQAAVTVLANHNPDVVLFDVAASAASAEQAARLLLRTSPHSRVVVVTDEGPVASRLLNAGASACVTTNISPDELMTTLCAVVRDPCRVIVSLSRHQFLRLAPRGRTGLSNREDEILRLVADGEKNSAIAEHLFISLGTVKRHLSNIYAKLHVGSRIEASQVVNRLEEAVGDGANGLGDLTLEPHQFGGNGAEPPSHPVL